jgi:hypothetical protein
MQERKPLNLSVNKQGDLIGTALQSAGAAAWDVVEVEPSRRAS